MFHYLYTQIRTLIAPPLCSYCKIFLSQPDILCSTCAGRILPIVSNSMPINARYTMPVHAISAYQDPLKSLILAKSYSNIVASAQLGELMWQRTNIAQAQFDYIVPIPLHWTRFARRGFNQAHEMAKVISKHSGKPVHTLLQRTKRTQYQAALDAQERPSNVKDAFVLSANNAPLYKDKHLLLVDDLMTTGSTLRVAARELALLKPASMTAVVACRVV